MTNFSFKILNLGGPDDGMTMKQQGEMLFEVTVRSANFKRTVA